MRRCVKSQRLRTADGLFRLLSSSLSLRTEGCGSWFFNLSVWLYVISSVLAAAVERGRIHGRFILTYGDSRPLPPSRNETMVLKGTIKNGVVVLDGGPVLPDGTPVQVAVNTATPQDALGKRLMRFAGTVTNLPSDMAEQHDHYLHGQPRK